MAHRFAWTFSGFFSIQETTRFARTLLELWKNELQVPS